MYISKIYSADMVSTIFLFCFLFTFKKFIVLCAATVVNLSSTVAICILGVLIIAIIALLILLLINRKNEKNKTNVSN